MKREHITLAAFTVMLAAVGYVLYRRSLQQAIPLDPTQARLQAAYDLVRRGGYGQGVSVEHVWEWMQQCPDAQTLHAACHMANVGDHDMAEKIINGYRERAGWSTYQ